MNKDITEINAFIYGKKIGILILQDGDIYFEYDKVFMGLNLEISPLKLHTSQGKQLYTNQDNKSLYGGMAGVFFDSLPDKYGMAFIDRHFENKGFNVREISLLHKLAFIGDRGMGAIEYEPKENSSNYDIENAINIKEVYEDMKRTLDNKNINSIEFLMSIIGSVSPVGGGRPKMLIIYNEKTNEIKFNNKKLEIGYKRAIIKFDEAYYENESLHWTKLEYLYMTMAKECGINTSRFIMYQENEMNHLIIERFDRDENDNKIHIVTASGLMHKDISISNIMSYEELFSFAFKLCNKQSTIQELFKIMVFNALSINYDDHAKNFSFMMDSLGDWDLAPAYDITYSKGLATRHATTINGKGKDFLLEDFLNIAKQNLIKHSTAMDIIKNIVNKLNTFESRAKNLNINDKLINECKKDIDNQLSLIK